jgi:hypothetical protein
MASIPQEYREAMKTWTLANAHKAVYTAEWQERVTEVIQVEDPIDGSFLDKTVRVEPPQYIDRTEDYIDLHELAWRLGRKIWKAAPELRGTFDLEDLEELLDDKKDLIFAATGVSKSGAGTLSLTEINAEDPDL